MLAPASPLGSPDRGRAARRHWLLEEGTTYLNHGAFGATPRAVIAAQDELRVRAERQPVRFFLAEAPELLRDAADLLARFLGARGPDLGFVENATAGMGAVLRSLRLGPGDEVLATNHAYPAVLNALRFLCRRRGCRLVVAEVPYPLDGPGAVVDAVAEALSPRTRVIVVDHVTSLTGLILPVRDVVSLARARDIPVLVDGAHAPGMLELDVPALDADWYVGNCHKWLCSAKGCAFVWRNPAAAGVRIHPPVISHALDEPFPAEFDWVGTRDLSAWLSLPAALEFHARMGGPGLRADNRALARQGADLLADAWEVTPPAPDSMFGSLAVVPMPGTPPPIEAATGNREAARIRARHGIEVAVTGFAGRLWCRVSAQAYNVLDDYARLADALDPALVGTA